ncbi:MAG: hypothetical protein NTZ05_17440 [Chloroflexi bacterium]|nr:hypothetical protein [Chloroflexota bacterium]
MDMGLVRGLARALAVLGSMLLMIGILLLLDSSGIATIIAQIPLSRTTIDFITAPQHVQEAQIVLPRLLVILAVLMSSLLSFVAWGVPTGLCEIHAQQERIRTQLDRSAATVSEPTLFFP